MSSISFAEVPSNARVPGMYVEIDNSLANSAIAQQSVLLIALGKTGASTPVNTPVLCMNTASAEAQFGKGSDIAVMVAHFRAQNESMPIYAVSVEAQKILPALAALGDVQYHHIVCALSDDTSVRQLAEFLETRYSALNQIPGIGYVPATGNHAQLITFANKCNSPLVSFMPCSNLVSAANTALTPAAAIAAWAGQIAPSLANDPCRPLQTLVLNGVYFSGATHWDWAERNLLLHEGMSTYTVNSAKQVLVERVVTAYTENGSGMADDSYLDVMTPATAMYFRERQRSRILSKYARYKVAKNGTVFAPGQVIVTPDIIKGELLTLYQELEYNGIVQDFDGYKKSLVVELDDTNKQRVNYLDSPQFVNGLIIVAGKIQFRK